MRKILTREEIAERDKKRGRIISIVLLGIMVFSLAAGAFVYSGDDNQNNNDQQTKEGEVKNYGDRWIATFAGQTFSFAYGPETSFNVTEINFIPDSTRYAGKPLYIDSNSEGIYNELTINIGRLADRYQYACYKDCDNSTWAQKDCSDNLIVYTPADKNKVTQNQSCIFIEGDMRAVDAFLYREIGIA